MVTYISNSSTNIISKRQKEILEEFNEISQIEIRDQKLFEKRRNSEKIVI